MRIEKKLATFTLTIGLDDVDYEAAREDELDRLVEAASDEAEMGLIAVAENLRGKFGKGRLRTKVEV